ncbi:uncharacterized protein [Typha angustifolia]|uniref:uncharacterized protein isoform X1 n=1 Tax=Typha angustifolia TaxID=59011 RepID=UPI003C2D8414
MARVFYQSLISTSQTLILNPSSSFHLSGALRLPFLPSSARFLALRLRSHRADRGHLIEIDLGAGDSSSSSSDSSGDVEVVGVRRLEDAIHGIIVRRSAPDWLPFLPGSSYWVPPRRRAAAAGMVELVGRFANPMSEEEMLSLTSARGWPSSGYFVEACASPQLAKKIPKKAAVQSDDEE